ncbi:DUF4177 domain-containing protein [Desulfopila sp. IMCC35008]|uniref:DUF4177 domain-containing protein n=1 Tax=Desulfopila sp. IMCC35008 TaxID=2653858 RepID=UPI0013D095A8|nr:DUF4177 domain-containing protein [Desulfopila sp. IMCC35008]
MRWSYKTIHFEMKKDGLLGGVFLDESEMEEILNEFGKAGWELISMLDTRDGIVGVFKQPLLEELQTKPYTPRQEETPVTMPVTPSEEDQGESGLMVYEQLEEETPAEEPEDDIVEEWEAVEDADVESEPELTTELDDDSPEDDDAPDVGSIRIE